MFEGISLSTNTVASRITDLASNVHQQLAAVAKDFEAFLIAVDECSCVTDIATVCIHSKG